MTTHRSTLRLTRAAIAVLAAASLVAACGDDDDDVAVTGGEVPGADLEVTGAWARTSPAVATAGAVYLTITNDGDADDALLAADVDPSVAASVEIHETVAVEGDGMTTETTGMGDEMSSDTTGMGGGMMEMQPVDEIPIPAGETVALEPGGYHVMLLDLAEPLEVGDTIDVTLTFEEADDMTVTAEVRDDAP